MVCVGASCVWAFSFVDSSYSMLAFFRGIFTSEFHAMVLGCNKRLEEMNHRIRGSGERSPSGNPSGDSSGDPSGRPSRPILGPSIAHDVGRTEARQNVHSVLAGERFRPVKRCQIDPFWAASQEAMAVSNGRFERRYDYWGHFWHPSDGL